MKDDVLDKVEEDIITEIPIKPEPPKEPVILQGFKAFNQDMKCLDFQYEENKLFTYDGEIDICSKGFHFCEALLDCYNYYPLNSDTIICKVESQGEAIKIRDMHSRYYTYSNLDTKTVTNKLYIKEKLSKTELLEYLLKNKFNLGNPIDKELFTSVKSSLDNKYWDEAIINKTIKDFSLTLFCNDTIDLFMHNGFTREQSFELLKIRYNKSTEY